MILQDFLVCGLVEIGEEDKRLEWLEAAATDLAKALLKTKRKLINYTLVALDDDLPETEPVFAEVEAAVTAHWKALRGKFPELPRQLLRGVILAALDKVKEDAMAASIVWLIGGSILPYGRVKKERPVVEKLIAQMGDTAENAAAEAWATVRPAKEPKLPGWDVKAKPFKQIKAEATWLQERLGAAAGSGQNLEGFPNNANWQLGGHPQHTQAWAKHFSTQAANAISGQINTVLAPISEQVSSLLAQLEEPLKTHSTAVTAAVRDAIRQGIECQLAQQQRTALLWWQRALYSPSRRRGYRGLASASVAVLMAVDLHKEVPLLVPQSVEFLLRETVRDAAGSDVSLSGQQFLEGVTSDKQSLALPELLGPATSGDGRICLVEFVRQVLSGKAVMPAMSLRVGISASQVMPVEEWTVWLFRDLQALRLGNQK